MNAERVAKLREEVAMHRRVLNEDSSFGDPRTISSVLTDVLVVIDEILQDMRNISGWG